MEYTLIRSVRKTIAAEIARDGSLILRAPSRCSQKQIDLFLQKHEVWIENHIKRQLSRAAAHPEPDEAQKEALIARAKLILPERTAYFAELMGLFPTAVTITGARTRFGSCSATNRICFSWRLTQYPDAAVDYVVVHELAHIIHKNHGKDFYALVSLVLPDWKERKKMLRE